MRVAIIGANGQLGSDLCRVFSRRGDEVLPLIHADIEIADLDSVCRVLGRLDPDVTVNTAAMHHLPSCEADPERALAVNALGARNLAVFSREHGSVLVHLSTDHVFDGSKRSPYVEGDRPRPLNVYGISKLAGEHLIRSTALKYFIVRTSGLYGENPCRATGQNFVNTMLKLANERDVVRVVDDEVATPTPSQEVARQIVTLTETGAYGLYHATAEGECSWYEFAAEIFSLTRANVRLEPTAPGPHDSGVARPSYSVLGNVALQARGLSRFGTWQQGLRRYLRSSIAVAS